MSFNRRLYSTLELDLQDRDPVDSDFRFRHKFRRCTIDRVSSTNPLLKTYLLIQPISIRVDGLLTRTRHDCRG